MGRGAEGSEGDQSRAELSRGGKGDPGQTQDIRETLLYLFSYFMFYVNIKIEFD